MSKTLLVVPAVILLVASLFGCAAPASSTGEETTSSEAATAEYRWAPATWIGTGPLWDALNYFGDYLEDMSGGRFEVTPSAPGAICPVDEQAEAVSGGLTPIMAPAGTYYAGKIPVTDVYGAGVGLPDYREYVKAFQYFEGGKAQRLVWDAYEELFNVVVVGELIGPQDIVFASNKPINSLADIAGQKLRCGDSAIAAPLTELGASTTWIPASEVYTALATGVFDGFTMGNAADDYAMAFHEVTDYWLRSPSMMTLHAEPFLVNRDVWNELPDDLKEMVIVAADAAASRCQWESEMAILEAWEAVIDYGVTPVRWSDDDTEEYIRVQMRWAEDIATKDPRTAELLGIIAAYRQFAGFD